MFRKIFQFHSWVFRWKKVEKHYVFFLYKMKSINYSFLIWLKWSESWKVSAEIANKILVNFSFKKMLSFSYFWSFSVWKTFWKVAWFSSSSSRLSLSLLSLDDTSRRICKLLHKNFHYSKKMNKVGCLYLPVEKSELISSSNSSILIELSSTVWSMKMLRPS